MKIRQSTKAKMLNAVISAMRSERPYRDYAELEKERIQGTAGYYCIITWELAVLGLAVSLMTNETDRTQFRKDCGDLRADLSDTVG